jgi:nucleoside-diphosphate-sugar epimerase
MALVGGNGWLGREIVGTAGQQGLDVTVVPRDVASDRGALADALWDMDVVVNAAGCTNPGPDEHEQAVAANEKLPARLAELAAENGWRLVHIGSAAEYGPGASGPTPLTEDRACAPVSLYGQTKLAGTQAVLHGRKRGADAIVARVFNLVDAELPAHNPIHDVAAPFLAAAASTKGPPVVEIEVGIGDPTTTRDLATRGWAAAAIVELARCDDPWPPLVNVCSGRATSFGELAEALARQLHLQLSVQDLGWPRGGRIVGDPALLRDLVPLAPPERPDALARSILAGESQC